MITRRALLAGAALGGLAGCDDGFGAVLATLPAGTRGVAASEDQVFVVGGGSQGFLWRVPREGGTVHAIHDRLVQPRDVIVAEGRVIVATDGGLMRQSVHGTRPEQVLSEPVRWVRGGALGVAWARAEGEVGVVGGASVDLGVEIRGLAAAETLWVSTPEEVIELTPRGRVAQRLPFEAPGAMIAGQVLATPRALRRLDGTPLVTTEAATALVAHQGALAWIDARGLGHWSPGAGARWLRGARAQGILLEADAVLWTEAKTRRLRRSALTSFA